MNRLKSTIVVALAVLWIPLLSAGAQWYRGSTHIHTSNSVGDSTPDEVVSWYRESGYNFVFITDHKMVTNVVPLNSVFAIPGQFLVLPGEEVSSNFVTPGGKVYVHVNSLNPRQAVTALHGETAGDTLQKDVNAIVAAGGMAQINHPNFMWQLNAQDIATAKGARLLEIMNMQPVVNSRGTGPDAPGVEDVWDQVLSRGVTLWAVASDDASEFKNHDGNSLEGRPGKGWIVVRAEHLTATEIMQAIDRGDFYASTGITLKDYRVEGRQITIELPDKNVYLTKYRTRFIGKGGVILKDTSATPAVYAIQGNEGYVRARICDSNGNMAWTQPVAVPTR